MPRVVGEIVKKRTKTDREEDRERKERRKRDEKRKRCDSRKRDEEDKERMKFSQNLGGPQSPEGNSFSIGNIPNERGRDRRGGSAGQ